MACSETPRSRIGFETAPMTSFEKIWRQHEIATLPGGVSLLQIDRHYIHDLEAAPGLARIEAQGHGVARPDLTFATPDHAVSSAPCRHADTNPAGGCLLRDLRRRAAQTGIRLFDLGDPGHGIVHVMAPELGLTLPGMTIVCGDSHTCTHGGLGALAFGIGSSEVAHVLATQTLRQKRPASLRLWFDGRLSPGITAKDLILHTIGRLGTAAGRGHAIEFAGPTIAALSADERMTLCNMSIELGSKIGLVAPDDTTFGYVAGRAHAPAGRAFDEALAHWRSLASDDEARFDAEYRLDAGLVAPQITWGTSPQDVIAVDGHVPDPGRAPDGKAREAMEKALTYMGLEPGAPIEGTPIDWVFIGSCVNGRLSDLREAARLLDGRHVAGHVRAWVVPGSERTKREAEAEGLHEIFQRAGFQWRQPGCSMCLAANGERVGPGERSVSTTNRNFVGRQGPGARTHLASPASAAAAAVSGAIVDIRKFAAGAA